ncbi:MAG: glycosyltransferase family 25 protein [Gammaproteobacteria bacterium]|nr:glycosyltransferase family 25 protein [Gammaproteobacteria bacterium]
MSSHSVPIYVINLDDNQPRLADVTEQLEVLNLNFERISAVAGRRLTEQEITECYDANNNLKHHHRDLTKGEMGCYLSHRKIWQKMVDGQIPKALILEDDIRIQPRLLEALDIANKSQGWEVIKVADAESVCPAHSKELTDNMTLVSYFKVPNRTMGYFITLEAAKKMLSLKRFYRPVDVDFQFHTDFDVSVCGITPNCIDISPEFGLEEQSDIVRQNQSEHNNHSTFFRNLKYRYSLYKRRKTESYQISDFYFIDK